MLFLVVGIFWALGSFGAEVSTMTSILWAIPGVIFGLVLGTRAFRMGVRASRTGLTIRNLGKTYDLAWSEVQSISVGRSSGASTLLIEERGGGTIVGRGASSYSANQVKTWLGDVLSAAPTSWLDRDLGGVDPL